MAGERADLPAPVVPAPGIGAGEQQPTVYEPNEMLQTVGDVVSGLLDTTPAGGHVRRETILWGGYAALLRKMLDDARQEIHELRAQLRETEKSEGACQVDLERTRVNLSLATRDRTIRAALATFGALFISAANAVRTNAGEVAVVAGIAGAVMVVLAFVPWPGSSK